MNKKDRISLPAHLLLMLLTLIMLIPFYITVINAFKVNADIMQSPMEIPFGNLTLANFHKAFTSQTFNILSGYLTSTWITVTSGFFIVLISSMSSYILARNKTRLFKGIFYYFIIGLMLPSSVLLLPLLKLLTGLHLIHTTYGLILVNIGAYMPFTLFLYTGFVRTISEHLDESAKIDGANIFTTFWRIIFPLLRPATGAIVIFLFIFIWNDFLNPLYILGPTAAYTVTIGIYFSIGKFSVDWQNVFSTIVLASLPIFILFIFMQKQFIGGLTQGSLKG